MIKKYSKPTPPVFKERTLNWIYEATQKQKILCGNLKKFIKGDFMLSDLPIS